jgi:hypothetical protein
MKAWLVNTSGNPNSYKLADLLQEHLNLQIEVSNLLSVRILSTFYRLSTKPMVGMVSND